MKRFETRNNAAQAFNAAKVNTWKRKDFKTKNASFSYYSSNFSLKLPFFHVIAPLAWDFLASTDLHGFINMANLGVETPDESHQCINKIYNRVVNVLKGRATVSKDRVIQSLNTFLAHCISFIDWGYVAVEGFNHTHLLIIQIL